MPLVIHTFGPTFETFIILWHELF